MSQYGEITGSKACVFQYKDGYRVDYYGEFRESSGGGDTNIVGAALGRLFTKAVGLGDSSRFMKDTLDSFEANMKSTKADMKLVELYPQMDGKTVEKDPAPALTQTEQANLAGQSPGLAVSNLPPQLQAFQQKLNATINSPDFQKKLDMIRAKNAEIHESAYGMPSADDPRLQARKELTEMGLSYFNQQQFMDAIKRGDKMAVELFVKAGGVDINAAEADGKTPLMLANSPDISDLLKSAGAH